MGYKTKHSDEVIHFLDATRGEHFTAADVIEHFRRQGSKIGAATVYRQLDKLVAGGTVAKYVLDSSGSACYEYLGGSEECHRESGRCYHLKCTVCGKIIHLHSPALDSVTLGIAQENGFDIDCIRTVFCGICKDCKETAGENND